MIIAIDGPAGTGKGTISKLISERLGYTYIDTGAMYRAITLKMIQQNIKLEDLAGIEKLLNTTEISISNDGKIYLDGKDVSKEIRLPQVNELVAKVSDIKFIREKLVSMQRKMGENKNIVMEGRDITTVVFPNADFKIYLTADETERARRRYKEMIENGIDITFDEVLKNIRDRDYIDTHKEMGALKIADGAIVIDFTNKTIEEVYNEIKSYIKKEEN